MACAGIGRHWSRFACARRLREIRTEPTEAKEFQQCGAVQYSARADVACASREGSTHDSYSNLASDWSGRLQRFPYDAGDYSSEWTGGQSRSRSRAKGKAGEAMLYVSSPDYSQLRTNYLKAKEAYALAQKAYSRAKDLLEHQAIAEQNVEQSESAEAQAGGDLAAAKLH